MVECSFFYLNVIGKTQWNLISLFCDDKYFTTAAHFGFNVKVLKINLTAFRYFFHLRDFSKYTFVRMFSQVKVMVAHIIFLLTNQAIRFIRFIPPYSTQVAHFKTNREKTEILYASFRFRKDRDSKTAHLWRCMKQVCKVRCRTYVENTIILFLEDDSIVTM